MKLMQMMIAIGVMIMNKEEYIKYVESNNELKRDAETNINLMAILKILIEKGVCTDKEFEEKRKQCKDGFYDMTYKKISKEDLDRMKTMMDLINMCGIKQNIPLKLTKIPRIQRLR